MKFWEGDAPPVFSIDGTNYLYIKKSGLLFVCTTRFNVSPSMIIELLNRISKVIKDYCGVLSEEAIRKNFILVYELLDEILDYGFPQVSVRRAWDDALDPSFHTSPLDASTPPFFPCARATEGDIH